MSDIIREPRLEATKFFKYQIDKNARCIHEFFKSVSASQWSLSTFVKYIAKLETGLGFEQLFKVFVKSLDKICVLLVVPVCVRAFAQNYLKWLETFTGKAMVNECRGYFFAKVTLQEKTELKDVFKDTVNVTAQAEAYRAYITAPAMPTKSSGTDVQERHNDKVDEELIEASKEKKRKDEDDVTVVTSTPPTKRSRSCYESSYSPSPSEVEELPSLATDSVFNDDNYERDVPQLSDDYSEEKEKLIIEDQNNVVSPLRAVRETSENEVISTISTAKSTCNDNDEESSSSLLVNSNDEINQFFNSPSEKGPTHFIKASSDEPSTSSAIGDDDLDALELDLLKFEEAYMELDQNRMWTLKSGRKVEEVIYKFARNLNGESCLHSFIISDADLVAESLFSDDEWKEIFASEVKSFPKLDRSYIELMKKYTIDDINDLRKVLYEPTVNEYNNELHFDLDFINFAYRSMLFLWQKAENPFNDSKLEGWYEMNIWGRLIDPAFDNQNIDLVRGEGMSYASSDRKNYKRITNERKKIGRKGDGVFRLRGDRLEFGAIEAGRKWEGKSGTKYLNDSLKIKKILKDMMGQLVIACNGREDLTRKLQVVGILNGANRIQVLIMDYPKGYISRIKQA